MIYVTVIFIQTNKNRRENIWLLKSMHKLLAYPKPKADMVAKAKKNYTDYLLHFFVLVCVYE